MAEKLITAATAWPVDETYIKNVAQIDGSDSDTFLGYLKQAAPDFVTRRTGLCFCTQVWQYALDAPPAGADWDWYLAHQVRMSWNPGIGDALELPKYPVQATDGALTGGWIKYYSTDNTENTFAAASYRVDNRSTTGRRGRVYLNSGYSWPDGLRDRDAIVVQYTAGWDTAGSEVIPEDMKLAVAQLAAFWFRNREMIGVGMPEEIAAHFGALAAPDL